MTAGFWIFTSTMALVAIAFVAAPIVRHGRPFLPAGVIAAVPLTAFGLYLIVGSPQAAVVEPQMHRPMQSAASPSPTRKQSVGSVAGMVDGLAARLRDNPDDGKSWLLLARSYHYLKRDAEARAAYQHAAALGEFDEGLATLAESAAPAASDGARIRGHVSLSPQYRDIVLPTDTVFIFARAVGGPPMPVAVLRQPASRLPLDFELDDSRAISADAVLSDHDRVVVTARISRSGVAAEALQDLEARSDEILVADNRQIKLIIE